MLIGQTIVAYDGQATEVWTPFFPRQGFALTSSFEIIRMPADTEIEVEVFHKNSEIATQGASAGTGKSVTAAVTTPTVYTFRNDGNPAGSGIDELVRYKVTLSYTGATSNAVTECHFRILTPSWETTGAQGV